MFRIQWAKAARTELARIWTSADPMLRQAITRAAHRIDQKLMRQPDTIGESRDANRRVLIDEPLAILYCLFPDDNRVRVTQVWLPVQPA